MESLYPVESLGEGVAAVGGVIHPQGPHECDSGAFGREPGEAARSLPARFCVAGREGHSDGTKVQPAESA